MNLKYTIGAILSIPLLPFMYWQSRQIRALVPDLPEATGPEGFCRYQASQKEPLKMICLGESTIAGVGVKTHQEGFAGTLAQSLSKRFQTDISWKVYAKSGFTARSLHQSILPQIEETEIDLIVIGVGANDAFTLNTPRKWKQQVSQLITDLRAKFPHSLIVFCSMPPIKEFPAFTPLIKFVIGNLVEILGEELKKLVSNFENVYYHHEIIVFDVWLERLGIEGQKSDFFSDGVHPSKLTYQTWAEDTARLIGNSKEAQTALQKWL